MWSVSSSSLFSSPDLTCSSPHPPFISAARLLKQVKCKVRWDWWRQHQYRLVLDFSGECRSDHVQMRVNWAHRLHCGIMGVYDLLRQISECVTITKQHHVLTVRMMLWSLNKNDGEKHSLEHIQLIFQAKIKFWYLHFIFKII